MSKQILTATIPHDALGERLDVAIGPLFSDYSRSRIQQWIKDGNVTINGVAWLKPRQPVLGGEKVELIAQIDNEIDIPAQEIELDILYEDDAIMVINKPVGLVVHPGAGNPDMTLMNALLFHNDKLREVPRAGIVHRLDKETSGLMVVAKTVPAQTNLVSQLSRHAVERLYDAVVVGKMANGGTVDQPIGRSSADRKKMAIRHFGGKEAISHYRVLERFREHTRIRVKLETGRTHQIRVHMAHLGFPLVGDPVYGKRFRIPKQMNEEFVVFLRNFKHQALHAGALSLTHPVTGKTMKWKVDMPDAMFELIDVLREDMEMYESRNMGYDDYDYDHGVEVEWVTDEDIPD
ncbi:23S rRNA pseudouridine(1911/1915/1917) synthase RluD [Thiomicrorhabdus aquaedulcis]|uniref:23S rRNA pseudouridine(1911/1915/1917) synthase RluD n=1 Tax=Thiomicrorhabdus aquaedulcis TaxID=2211106 RepID=UPI000FD8144D|nr:23S rRNA pseudouridine(1911/1915/1917) synthase RluD [Thiomicrorhabdus aquaedulcis]